MLETTISEGAIRTRENSTTVHCVDSFSMSVIANWASYCEPRPPYGEDSYGYGPFEKVEVGFPTSRPEPWDTWETYCENTGSPTNTIYGYVPVDTVRDLVALHGGEADE